MPAYVPVYLPVPAGYEVCVTQPYFMLEHVITGTASVVVDLRVVTQARVRQCLETCTRSSSSSSSSNSSSRKSRKRRRSNCCGCITSTVLVVVMAVSLAAAAAAVDAIVVVGCYVTIVMVGRHSVYNYLLAAK